MQIGDTLSSDELDLSASLLREEGLPRFRGDFFQAWIESRGEPVWRDPLPGIVRAWLAELAAALGTDYESAESASFLVHAPRRSGSAPQLLRFADRCRAMLLSVLGEIAEFGRFGKTVVLVLRDRRDYYRYIGPFYPEGDYGDSVGCHVREGYPHIALHGVRTRGVEGVEGTLAHELVHAALHHLPMPLWLEEGLAQLFARSLLSASTFTEPRLVLDEQTAGLHRRYWRRYGLDAFWTGEAFSSPGARAVLSYTLAEVLLQLLFEDSRRQLAAFVRSASDTDGGAAACREHLDCSLGELAARFLGPGQWSSV